MYVCIMHIRDQLGMSRMHTDTHMQRLGEGGGAAYRIKERRRGTAHQTLARQVEQLEWSVAG